MAEINNVMLTDKHWKILIFASEFYDKNKVGPLYNNIKKNTDLSKEEVDKLFPHGLNSVYRWTDIPIQSTSDLCTPVLDIHPGDYREIYLDYNGTTFVRERIADLINEYYHSTAKFGNPSSSTSIGKSAHQLIQTAREEVAQSLRVESTEIIFTGSGSEANNMAIKGLAFQHLLSKGHLITDKTEHPSVLRTMKYLEELGFEVTYLDVDNYGMVNPEDVSKSIRQDTILVSVMAVNNEIGTVNPVGEIGAICASRGIPFMVDAIQAFGKIPVFPRESNISLLSISGHKIYAPKGVGALYVDKTIKLLPLIHGGEQESGLRAGTENVASIMALGKASVMICSEMEAETERMLKLKDFFISELDRLAAGYVINGHPVKRNPNNLSIGFPGIDSHALLLALNQIGVFVSAGSACNSGNKEHSQVLKAIKADVENFGTIRFSFGLKTTEEDLKYLFKYLPEILEKIR